MKVHIKNFGAVKVGGDIDLKPLTVFIGPNNSGKTWTAYLISAILGWPGGNFYTREYINNKIDKKYDMVDDAVNDVIKKGRASINLLDFYNLYYSDFINDVAKNSKVWFNRFMQTSKTVNNHDVSISFDEPLNEYIERLKRLEVEDSIGVGVSVEKDKGGLLNVKKDVNDPIMYFYTTEPNIKDKLPLKTVSNFIVGNIFRAVQRSFFDYVRYFPSERTGVVAIEASKPYRKKDELKSQEQAVNRVVNEAPVNSVILSVPLRSMVDFIRNVKRSDYRRTCDNCNDKCSKREDRKRYRELSDILENNILSGNLGFTEPGPDGTSDFIYKYQGLIDLDIPLTSSSIKDLMILAFYLRYSADRDELVIIDEPEMNLHPLAQAQFAEMLGMMVNSGLKVIITTQSTFIVDHLANLIKAKKILNDKNVQDMEKLFYLKNKDAFISQNLVSAYLFEKNKITPILKKNGLIYWNTFSDVSEKLSTIYDDMDDIEHAI